MVIGGKEYRQIVVADSEGTVIAVITDNSAVEHTGYTVILT